MAFDGEGLQPLYIRACLGPDRAAHTPSTYNCELWAGDPRDTDEGSHEVSGGDYAAQPVDADDFVLIDALQMAPATAIEFTTSATAPYDDPATHYALRDPVTLSAIIGPLEVPVDPGVGDIVRVTPPVYFADPD